MKRRQFLTIATATWVEFLSPALANAEPLVSWKESKDPETRLLGICGDIVVYINQQLDDAFKAGKRPVIAFGETHNCALDCFLQVISVKVIDAYLKKNKPEYKLLPAFEAFSCNKDAPYRLSELLESPVTQASLEETQFTAARDLKVNGMTTYWLLKAIKQIGAAEQILLLQPSGDTDKEGANDLTKPRANEKVYLLKNAEPLKPSKVVTEQAFESFCDDLRSELGQFDKVAGKRINSALAADPKTVVFAVVGDSHLEALNKTVAIGKNALILIANQSEAIANLPLFKEAAMQPQAIGWTARLKDQNNLGSLNPDDYDVGNVVKVLFGQKLAEQKFVAEGKLFDTGAAGVNLDDSVVSTLVGDALKVYKAVSPTAKSAAIR